MIICGTNNESIGFFGRALGKNHSCILCNSTSNFDRDIILQKALNRAVD